ncbi:hypothetical protein GCM10023339_39970 [Alloalcanivorax gelatiniphagus]
MTTASSPRTRRPDNDQDRRWHHVERLQAEHPPLELDAVDFTIRRPGVVLERFAGVLDYMARAELEVERNVLELATLLPDPPPIDRFFYADVWQPQEARHGLILDELLVRLGHRPAQTDLSTVSLKVRLIGGLAHLAPCRTSSGCSTTSPG